MEPRLYRRQYDIKKRGPLLHLLRRSVQYLYNDVLNATFNSAIDEVLAPSARSICTECIQSFPYHPAAVEFQIDCAINLFADARNNCVIISLS